MLNRFNNQKGQSLIELLVAMTIFILVVSSIMFLTLDAQIANRQGAERTKASWLAGEGVEASLSIASRGWRYVIDGDHGLDNSMGYWDWQGSSNIFENIFTRRVTIEPVYRDVNGDIVETGGTLDFDTKKVTSKINWDFTTSRPSEVTIESLLINWRSIKWRQTTQAEFDLGTKDQTVTTLIDDGEIQLAQAITSEIFDWPFDVSGNYTYNPSDIEVASSQARLVNQGSAIGSTQNSGFDTDELPWVYNDWDQDVGEVNVTGRWNGNIGQTGGGIEIKVPRGRQDLVGGFFEQVFTITNSSPSFINADFSWMVSTFKDTPQLLEVYVFIDSTAGEPFIGSEIWSSGPLTGITNWASETIDVTSVLTTPGTYYFKIAVWVETDNNRAGAYQVRFDDVGVTWDTGSPSYVDTDPTIEPTASFVPADLVGWTDFQETATKNGGEIYYQLSDDDGTTWYYWDGGAWVVAGATDYNIASDVGSNISQFTTASGKIMFRAFLASDSTQLVILNNVRVVYEKTSISTYASVGTFESSNLNTGSGSSVFNYLDWTVDEPPATDVEFQFRTANSQNNLSSAIWVGPDGTSGSFYTIQGTTVEIDPGASGIRWLQYKAYLSSDGTATPVLRDVTLDYEP
ncbi:prepilin-type N-terminal cleavage/methylation domain-containing protein [Patescibacteria group bacterium]|nr:prepilin-type N-terminal cleavage/methylation domain-containing protein [Patescibacteria group bacterium]